MECFDLTADFPSAVLLSQLVYWNEPSKAGKTKLRVHRDGKWWIAKSHFEWWKECRLTRRQVDRAISRLLELKLIAVKILVWKGAPTRHIRLLSIAPTGAMCIAPTGANIYTESTKTSKKPTNVGLAGGKAPASNSFQGAMMNAAQQLDKFLAKHKPAKGFPDAMPIKNTSQLAVMWNRMVPYYHDIVVMKPLTKKEIGMLGQFLKAVGDQGAYAAMKRAVEHWQNFLIDIADETGDTLSSKSPQVGILLKYYHVAMAGTKKADKPAAVKSGVKVMSKQDKATLMK